MATIFVKGLFCKYLDMLRISDEANCSEMIANIDILEQTFQLYFFTNQESYSLLIKYKRGEAKKLPNFKKYMLTLHNAK